VLIVAWVYEVTPEGVKRETEVDRTRSIAPQTGRKLEREHYLAATLQSQADN